jgi:hypothetical protein
VGLSFLPRGSAVLLILTLNDRNFLNYLIKEQYLFPIFDQI